ncbi:MAG: type II toxin-antitoxin system VapC family toxin [Promethearchaeota archaeon]
MRISLDTNIFLSIKNKEDSSPFCEKILNVIEEKKFIGVLSTVVISEVLVGFYQNNEIWEADEFSQNITAYYKIIPVSLEVSQKGAKIRAKYNIKLPDALIVASLDLSETKILITLDKGLSKCSEILIMTPEKFVEKFLKQ